MELAASLDTSASELKQLVVVAREKATEITVLCARSCITKAMELDQTGADAHLNNASALIERFSRNNVWKESEVLDACQVEA